MTRAGFSCESRPDALYARPFCLYPPEKKKKEEEEERTSRISIHSVLSESPPSSGIKKTDVTRYMTLIFNSHAYPVGEESVFSLLRNG